ncbi:MAG: hypothetical protein CSA36_04315 [Draconibacterium sp.]|nr:MAG: hypothetical protein CSA36_04315 [Draconibacterium sp.]
MGHAYQYRCSHCGYSQEFNRGHGYHVHSQPLSKYLNQPRKYFHYKTHDVLKKLAEENSNLYLHAGFQVYKCPKCNLLFDKTDVAVFEADKVVHKSDFRCSRCRSRLKLTNIHRLKRANCPKCQKRTFHLQQMNLLWD